ncbi:MAG TPA: DUF192 domain-containing protein [Candidatus Nanoarchaeia archaeon]|nr:DUF192 domain-containing protein [Candidatus Nanoarchaeia archaeon]
MILNNPLICKSFLSQARGLMFRRPQDLVMIFKKPKGISLHMFFVFYPIDVFLLKENKEVIEIKRNFKPFTIYKSKNKAKYIIETPSLGQNVKIGDQCLIKNPNRSKLRGIQLVRIF